MADEFQSRGNWWDSSASRFESSLPRSLGSFNWPTDMADNKARSSVDSASLSGSSSAIAFQHTQKQQGSESDSAGGDGESNNFQITGLGLSSQPVGWNQTLLSSCREKEESSLRLMLQDNNSNPNGNFQEENGQRLQWRDQIGLSSGNEFKPMNRCFSLDQSQSSSCTTFQMDSSALYGTSSTTYQAGVQPEKPTSSSGFSYGGQSVLNSGDQLLPSWSKIPRFLRAPPPAAQQLSFSNIRPCWSASEAAMKDIRPSFFSSRQSSQFQAPAFREKPKRAASEGGDSTNTVLIKKSGSSDHNSKRPRSEAPSPLPAFKVRKEKMGDRITALQQLVSPFGKTDSASVLSEVIEYIKLLHEQVGVLSDPYMRSGTSMQHHQNSERSKDLEGSKKDLRSRGLCLVPVSCTFPVASETPLELWTPTFGGAFR